MSYRILIVNTDYGHFLDQLYGRNPALSASSFEVQQKARFDAFFGVNDFYSSNLRKLGHWAIDIIYNNKFSQYTWAVENGFAKRGLTQQEITALPDNWLAAVFVAQVKTYKPDVIVNLAMESVTSEILNRVRSAVKLIVGQHAAPITNSMCNLSEYDLFVSSIPAYVELFKSKGIRAEMSDPNETLGKRIREAEMQKIPYILVLGEKELKAKTVSVRHYDKGQLGEFEIKSLIEKILKEIGDKKF